MREKRRFETEADVTSIMGTHTWFDINAELVVVVVGPFEVVVVEETIVIVVVAVVVVVVVVEKIAW